MEHGKYIYIYNPMPTLWGVRVKEMSTFTFWYMHGLSSCFKFLFTPSEGGGGGANAC